jgi:lipopolysaccharide transport system permease protein
VFGNLAGISTDGLPQYLFYLAGITAWNYFSDCLIRLPLFFELNPTEVISKILAYES